MRKEHVETTYPADSRFRNKGLADRQAGENGRPGTVYLVGAGPGEAGLLTVKGRELLEKADCIVCDHLANPDLLQYARGNCELIYAGKTAGAHTMEQQEINRLLVQKAHCYGVVVRLKGGDVYVFGRGGEEGLYLREHGIPFQVVPGISSALAGPAYAGIPITHRGIAGGFRVIAAHGQNEVDFASLAATEDTCVFLMGLSKLKEIVSGLMEAGKSPSCPAAVISHATLPEQRTCAGTLETIEELAKADRMDTPALIVVGNAVGLREHLNFFEEKKLTGRKYLVTKVGEEASWLTEALKAEGARVTELQTGTLHFFEKAVSVEELKKCRWIVLTSRHGVEAFFGSLRHQQIDLRILSNMKFAVIGEKTAQALKEYGIYADLVPETFDSASLAEALKGAADSKERIFWGMPAGVQNGEFLCLKKKMDIFAAPLYENLDTAGENLRQIRRKQIKPGKEEEKQEDIQETGSILTEYEAVLFTCASSVRRFFENLNEKERQNLRDGAVCSISIGPKTTKALTDFGVTEIVQAKQASYEDMVRTVWDAARGKSLKKSTDL